MGDIKKIREEIALGGKNEKAKRYKELDLITSIDNDDNEIAASGALKELSDKMDEVIEKLNNTGGGSATTSLIQLRSSNRETNITDVKAKFGIVPIPFDIQDIVDVGFTHDARAKNTMITVDQTGRYEIYFNVVMYSTSPRVNPKIYIRKNGSVDIPCIGASGYIRNSNGHKSSSSSARCVINLVAGDFIEILSKCANDYGNAGNFARTVMRDDATTVIIKKIG